MATVFVKLCSKPHSFCQNDFKTMDSYRLEGKVPLAQSLNMTRNTDIPSKFEFVHVKYLLFHIKIQHGKSIIDHLISIPL